MLLDIYQVDAFTTDVFRGNPAAVVPLDRWLPDALMQAIAAENNLSETAFLVREGDGWGLRWFTPAVEVDLCGHATLATAWVLFNRLGVSDRQVTFHTRSGPLTVRPAGQGRLTMDFPARPGQPVAAPAALVPALGAAPRDVLAARDYLVVYDEPAIVRGLQPDLATLAGLDRFGIIVTAPGDDGFDCISRFFAPGEGIDEDPVTGSAHCTVAPYWAERLGKPVIRAYQASARGGILDCTVVGDRVTLTGDCAFYLEGKINV
ncbi:MAG: PhzF family phenazine biosynthesis protein [Alphaproteobacteria bacterium]|jgi:PhzF family phenazine biosynthesis protein|nr:PhzF family phenazine biosynthesis protein [Alphaproteobacteria bacterium]